MARIVASEVVFRRYLTIESRAVEFAAPAATRVEFDVAGHPDAEWSAVYVVPVHIKQQPPRVTLIREYHQGPGRFMLGCVAGAFSRRKHDTLEGCARAELSEEARLKGGTLHALMGGRALPELKWSGNSIYPFLCLDPEEDPAPLARDEEEVGLTRVDVALHDLPALFASGDLNAASIACLALALADPRISPLTLDFAPDSTHLLTGDADGEVSAWNLISTRRVWAHHCYQAHAGVLCLRCLPLADAATKPDASAGQLSVAFHLVTQGRDGEMKVWTLSSTWTAGEWRLQPPSDAATATWAAQTYTFCRFSAAGLPQAGWFAVAPAEEGEAVQVLSIPGCEPVCSLRVAEGKEKHGMVSSLALVPTRAPDAGDASTTGAGATGDALLAGGFESGAVVLWYLQLGRASAPVWAQLATVKVHTEPLLAVALSHGGADASHLLVTGSADDRVVFSRVSLGGRGPSGQPAGAQGASVVVKRTEILPRAGLNDVTIRPDGRLVVCAGWDGRLRVFSAKTLKPLAVLAYHSQQATGLAYTADSRLLASSGRDNAVALWDVYAPADASQPPRGPLDKLGVFNGGGGEADDTS